MSFIDTLQVLVDALPASAMSLAILAVVGTGVVAAYAPRVAAWWMGLGTPKQVAVVALPTFGLVVVFFDDFAIAVERLRDVSVLLVGAISLASLAAALLFRRDSLPERPDSLPDSIAEYVRESDGGSLVAVSTGFIVGLYMIALFFGYDPFPGLTSLDLLSIGLPVAGFSVVVVKVASLVGDG